MKNIFLATGLCLLVLMLCSVSACGGGDKSTTSATTSPPTTTAAATTTSATTSPPKTTTTATTPAQTTTTSTATVTVDPLTALLSKWTGLDPVQYDLTVTMPGQATMTGHIWQTKTKQKMQYVMEGVNTIFIFDKDENVMYAYMPDQNMATKMTLDPGKMAQGTGEGDMLDVLNKNATIVGTESIDGKECTVITFVSDNMNIKLWIWTDKGFPIRTEGTSSDGSLTIMEYTNIDFSDIPDSVFEIPEGVQIISM
jgi:outer membrane lipoprotein-sorting protein